VAFVISLGDGIPSSLSARCGWVSVLTPCVTLSGYGAGPQRRRELSCLEAPIPSSLPAAGGWVSILKPGVIDNEAVGGTSIADGAGDGAFAVCQKIHPSCDGEGVGDGITSSLPAAGGLVSVLTTCVTTGPLRRRELSCMEVPRASCTVAPGACAATATVAPAVAAAAAADVIAGAQVDGCIMSHPITMATMALRLMMR